MAISIGQTYQHKFNKEIKVEILDYTSKGYKVKQFTGKKSKTAFFDKIEFDKDKGIFILV